MIAGPVSSYSWDLFREIGRLSGVQLKVFHRPPGAEKIRAEFAHESFHGDGQAKETMIFDAREMTTGKLRRAMDVRRADAILIFGTKSKVAIAEALLHRRAGCPVFFAADTNIERIVPSSVRDWARLAVYRAMSVRISEAWALGLSNDHAFRLLGFKRLRALPFYSVTYNDLGSPRAVLADLAARPLKLLTIGRLAPEKNLEALVAAVAHPEVRPRVHLTIVGEGPARPVLEDLLRRLPAPNVRLVGAVAHSQLGNYFGEAHALVLPSRREPWGNVVTEALGMGIPVLATPAVGAAVSTAGRYGGIQISLGDDAVALRRGLLRFLEDLPFLSRAALAQSARARAEFGVENVAQRMIDAVAELRGERDHAANTTPPSRP